MTDKSTQSIIPDMDMINAYMEYMRRNNFSEMSMRRRWHIITLLDRTLPHGIAHTSRDELEQWLANPGWSQNTRATYRTALKSSYGFWADPDDPWIDADPTIGMAAASFVPGIARPVQDEELWAILDRAEEPYRLWALIAAYQGLRCIEIAGLHREHITQKELVVVRGKGGRPRRHDTDPQVWLAVKDVPAGPIAGREVTGAYVSQTASRHFQGQLGLKGVTMHRFRHWLGVNCQRIYKDIRVTQAVLGHRSLQSTQIYTDADLGQQRAARAMLPRPDAA